MKFWHLARRSLRRGGSARCKGRSTLERRWRSTSRTCPSAPRLWPAPRAHSVEWESPVERRKTIGLAAPCRARHPSRRLEPREAIKASAGTVPHRTAWRGGAQPAGDDPLREVRPASAAQPTGGPRRPRGLSACRPSPTKSGHAARRCGRCTSGWRRSLRVMHKPTWAYVRTMGGPTEPIAHT